MCRTPCSAGTATKGFYAEKLSEATFTNVTVENTATTSGVYFNIAQNAGIDINLKGEEAYQDLIFNNLTITGNGVGSKEGVGLAIKSSLRWGDIRASPCNPE